ncbi:DUF2262 domain-containing protein [Bacillaceae bacterium SIJ1]|uniref:DUF2262 domain-containing protein n=1 Tax=Litoribacterium kuwaitense TaxID=1398745 RepID=UPI0013EAE903|nr:DUF2262 domain-containing protein [Litoribacterium kuwaitense]NGP43807.1 DUF2262 domain-containing protein [Litoribacterium kuwaitense]
MNTEEEWCEFDRRFSEEVIEIVAVTGPTGIHAGRAGGKVLWNASISLVGWKERTNDAPLIEEERRLEWLANDQEWEKTKHLFSPYSMIRLLVRKGESSFMLLQALDTSYVDDSLQQLLDEAKKPVFYEDQTFGTFQLDKRVKLFEKNLSWAGEQGILYFDWDEDEGVMKASLKTAQTLFADELEWDRKIRTFAADELVGLANDWLMDIEEGEPEPMTNEQFINLMTFESMSVYPGGDFEIFFADGDMFAGHVIIVAGNIEGTFASAEMAG